MAARTRQLNHRLKGRKQAIIDRRATASPAPPIRPSSPSNVALMNGANAPTVSSTLPPHSQSSQSSPGGFVAVNARPQPDQNGNGASMTTRHDLMSKFHTLSERRTQSQPQPVNGATELRRPSMGPHPPSHPSTPLSGPSKPLSKPAESAPANLPRPPHHEAADLQHMMNSPVPIPNTPSSLLPAASQRGHQPQEKDDGGPFKVEMVHRMESLAKGERILPPCDRCRRLHMDCLKNLTACMGCTKKHAKCSWKEVRESELRSSFSHHPPLGSGMHSESDDLDVGDRASSGSPTTGVMSPAPPVRQGVTPAPSTTINAISNLGGTLHGPFSESRMLPARASPPKVDRERGVEAQLQEAAKSGLGLAHANARLGPPDGKASEYQAMVA